MLLFIYRSFALGVLFVAPRLARRGFLFISRRGLIVLWQVMFSDAKHGSVAFGASTLHGWPPVFEGYGSSSRNIIEPFATEAIDLHYRSLSTCDLPCKTGISGLCSSSSCKDTVCRRTFRPFQSFQ